MILTEEQLIPLFKGTLRVEPAANGYLVPKRFTAAGQAFYDTVKDYGKKAKATSCIRLELTTDSTQLEFDYTLECASSRKFAYFDLAVDGTVLHHTGFEGITQLCGRMHFDLPCGMHHVVLYFPSLFRAAICNVTLSDGAVFSPVEKACRLYCLGDSITQGYDAKFSCGTYANLLADRLNAEVLNQGIGGETFRPDMLDADIPFQPDYITVAYGTNDWSAHTDTQLTEGATEYFRRLADYFPSAKIFAITPIWRADHFRYTRAGSFENAVRIVTEAALSAGAVVIDGQKMIPHTPAVCSDAYLHPNDLGFQYYADRLYRELTPYL